MTQYLPLRSATSGAAIRGNADLDTLIWSAAHGAWYTGPGGGGGSVTSVFGRTGVVTAQSGDYDSYQVSNLSGVAGASVSDALDTLALSAGAVTSVFGRAGVVVAVTGDYDSDQVDNVSSVAGSSVSDALDTLFTRIITAANWQGGLREVANLAARNAIPAGNRDVGMTVYQVDTDQMWRLIGGIANGNFVDVTIGPASATAAGLVPAVGAADTILQSTGTAAAWVSPLTYGATFLSPTISQTVTVSATGQTMLMQAQNAATTGGRLKLQSGTGGTTPGEVALFVGTTQVTSFQRSNTADFVALGANPASAGFLRLPPGAGIKSREFAFGSDLDVYTSGTGFNSQVFGSANAGVVRYSGPAAGVTMTAGGTDVFSITTSVFNWLVPAATVGAAAGASGFTLSITNTNSGANSGGFLRLRAMGTTSGNTNGADVQIEGGKLNGTGVSGGIVMKLNQDDTQANMAIMFQIKQVIVAQRVTALNFPGTAGAGLTTTQMPANTGDLVTFIGNANVVPSANGVGGFILYSDSAKPAFRYNGVNLRFDGKQTTVGAAGAASALPALPLGYKTETLDGVSIAVPYYNAA